MKNNPFKPGDRVALYNNGIRWTCEIIDVDGHAIRVIGDTTRWHFKQCRKLVKKKQREWWMNIYADSVSAWKSKAKADSVAIVGRIECVHVVEKRGKK